MEKYSESVKDAQEKLELAEKKATDVSVDLWDSGRVSTLGGVLDMGMKGEGDLDIPSTRTEMVSSQEPRPGQACTNNPRQWVNQTTYHFPQRM